MAQTNPFSDRIDLDRQIDRSTELIAAIAKKMALLGANETDCEIQRVIGQLQGQLRVLNELCRDRTGTRQACINAILWKDVFQ